jgi:hypothetical protein
MADINIFLDQSNKKKKLPYGADTCAVAEAGAVADEKGGLDMSGMNSDVGDFPVQKERLKKLPRLKKL